jgi:hypothetical protein
MNTTATTPPAILCPEWCTRTPDDHAATYDAEDRIPWHRGAEIAGDGWDVTPMGSGDDVDPYLLRMDVPQLMDPDETLRLAATLKEAAEAMRG